MPTIRAHSRLSTRELVDMEEAQYVEVDDLHLPDAAKERAVNQLLDGDYFRDETTL